MEKLDPHSKHDSQHTSNSNATFKKYVDRSHVFQKMNLQLNSTESLFTECPGLILK